MLTSAPRRLTVAEPCRYCGKDAWTADELGAAHPCCRWWMGTEGRAYCESCRAARALRWLKPRQERAA
jgi:hypothetical protein